jgi:hypothetical protein
VGCEGLELHMLFSLHIDLIDLDPLPIFGMGSDSYEISNSIEINWREM